MADLSPQARDLIRQLCADRAETLIQAVASDEGLQQRASGPRKLGPGVLDICATVNMDPDKALELWRAVNADAEDFWRVEQAEVEYTRKLNAGYQREYRERRGDEQRRRHRDYMRDYRARHEK